MHTHKSPFYFTVIFLKCHLLYLLKYLSISVRPIYLGPTEKPKVSLPFPWTGVIKHVAQKSTEVWRCFWNLEDCISFLSVPKPVGEREPSWGAHLEESEDIAISVLHGFGDQGRNSAGSITHVRLTEGWEPIACPEVTLQSRAAQPTGMQRALLAEPQERMTTLQWSFGLVSCTGAQGRPWKFCTCMSPTWNLHFGGDHEKQNDQSLSHGHFSPPKQHPAVAESASPHQEPDQGTAPRQRPVKQWPYPGFGSGRLPSPFWEDCPPTFQLCCCSCGGWSLKEKWGDNENGRKTGHARLCNSVFPTAAVAAAPEENLDWAGSERLELSEKSKI